jgi:hypothetical protein
MRQWQVRQFLNLRREQAFYAFASWRMHTHSTACCDDAGSEIGGVRGDPSLQLIGIRMAQWCQSYSRCATAPAADRPTAALAGTGIYTHNAPTVEFAPTLVSAQAAAAAPVRCSPWLSLRLSTERTTTLSPINTTEYNSNGHTTHNGARDLQVAPAAAAVMKTGRLFQVLVTIAAASLSTLSLRHCPSPDSPEPE